MNENTFTSQRTHTRVKFQPLTTSCHLVCLTPMSPAAQTVNSLVSPPEYEPDRTATPTMILPEVRANDPDGVFHRGAANEFLSINAGDLQWFVDGEPIADVWTAGTDYEIDTSASDTRGMLRVKKNLPASAKAVLTFKGKFLDWRTGIPYNVESDEIALSCTDRGSDVLSCCVDKPNITYDPFYDLLLLYDYKVARGIAVQGTRDDYVDGKCYEQSVNVLLTSGTAELTALPSGTTMRVVRLGSSAALTPNSEAAPELLAATYPLVKFDMRMIAKGEYEVQFLQSGNIVARCTIGLHTSTTMPTGGKPLRGADITPAMKVYQNQVLLNTGDNVVDYPELYYLIQWYTQAKYNDNGVWKYAAEKIWQRGENILAAIADLDIGTTVNDSFFDQWFDCNAHAARELCLDESNAVLTDENGEYLID